MGRAPLVAQAALGLVPDASHRFFGERLGWLAERLGRDERTVRRIMNDALNMPAEVLDVPEPLPASRTRGEQLPASGWYTAALRALVRMNATTMEVIEKRRIIVTASTVNAVTVAVSLPRAGDGANDDRDLHADVLYGAFLGGLKRLSESHLIHPGVDPPPSPIMQPRRA